MIFSFYQKVDLRRKRQLRLLRPKRTIHNMNVSQGLNLIRRSET